MSDLEQLNDRIAQAVIEAPPKGEYAVSEKELRGLARQEIQEAETEFSLYEVPDHRAVLNGNTDPRDVGIAVRTASDVEVLRNKASRSGKVYVPDQNAEYGGGYFKERKRGGVKYYFIHKAR